MVRTFSSLFAAVNRHRRDRFARVATVVLAALLSAFDLRCIESPLEPVAPASDVQLSIPLLNRTKFTSDFASKDSSLTQRPDGSYLYTSTKTVKPVRIDTIKAMPTPSIEQVILGAFSITAPAPVGDTLDYFALTGSNPPPSSGPSPSQTFWVRPVSKTVGTSFEYVTFETGTLTLQIRNNLPVAIDVPGAIIIQNYRLTIPSDTNEVARFVFNNVTIQPGASYAINTDLAGRTLENIVIIPTFQIHAQPSVNPVVFKQGSGIDYLLSTSNVTARSTRAIIPSQSLVQSRDSVFTLDDSLSIQSAYFSGGSFDVVFQNTIDLSVKVFLEFNEIRNRSTGSKLRLEAAFDGAGVVRVPVNASTITVQSVATGFGTRVTYSSGIESIVSQQMRKVSSSDFVSVELQPRSTLIVQSFTGRIKPTHLPYSSGVSGVDFGSSAENYKGNFSFDSIRAAIGLTMSSGFPTDYDLRLVAMNRRISPPRIDSLNFPTPVGSVLRRIYPGPGTKAQIVLDNSNGLNTFLSRFYPNLPDTFVVRGSLLINPPDVYPTMQGIQSVYDTSKVYTGVDLSFPVKLALAAGELTDTVSIGSSAHSAQDFSKSVKSATVYFEVSNGLPIQLTFRAALLQKSRLGSMDTLLWLPTDGSRTIAAAPVDNGGSVTGPRATAFSIQLTGAQAETFNIADAVWYRIQVETTGGGTTPVKIRSTDFVTVRASANMVYTVNKQ